jgi:hypothetical protein
MDRNVAEALWRIDECRQSGQVVLDLSTLLLSEVPHQVQTLTNLRWLNIGSNNLRSLPEWLVNLPNLHALFLYDNPFTDVPPEMIGKRHSSAPIKLLLEYLCAAGGADGATGMKGTTRGRSGDRQERSVASPNGEHFRQEAATDPRGRDPRLEPATGRARPPAPPLRFRRADSHAQHTPVLPDDPQPLPARAGLDPERGKQRVVKWLKTIHLYSPHCATRGGLAAFPTFLQNTINPWRPTGSISSATRMCIRTTRGYQRAIVPADNVYDAGR